MGEEFVGTLDFSCRTVRCVQVSVTLQCEVMLAAASAPASSANDGPLSLTTAADANAALASTGKNPGFTEVCDGQLQTQIILRVPLLGTGSFSLVDVRWRLHFEFVTHPSVTLRPLHQDQASWRAPPDNNGMESAVYAVSDFADANPMVHAEDRHRTYV